MSKEVKKDEITLFEHHLSRRRAFLCGDSVRIVEELWNVDTESWDDISSVFMRIEDIYKLCKWLKEQ